MVDAALQHNLKTFQDSSRRRSGGVALLALGSYARRSLCPRSDIDLLLLHDGWSAADLEELVRAVCYPLWDAGLSVGHAVRTSKEAVRSTGDRIDTATALTERRLVAGSQGMADDLKARMARWLRRSGGSLAKQIVAADAERHLRHGGTPGALEPDLKDGTGGLRDLHSLRWAGAILLGEAGLDPLVGARYLGAEDRALLAGAGERLLAARCALHLVTDTTVGNTLRLDLQDEVARRLGMADGDELLHDVGLATRTIAHLHARTWPVLLQDATRGRRRRPAPQAVGGSLHLVDGLIQIDADLTLGTETSVGMRAIAAAAQHRTVLGRTSAMRLHRQIKGEGRLSWDQASRDALLEVLWAGRGGMAAMGDADYLGLWSAYLPEWSRVRGRPQRNPLHTYDLDTHAMHAVAWLSDVVEGRLDPRHVGIFSHMSDPDSLALGTWLHDVGKAWPGDHSVAGETVGRDWVLHMGFTAERADQVARLIRHHLLLPDAATQRDMDDPAEVERVAVAVGDPETLDGLYLLSFADSRATGPPAWSEWKDLLIRQLYTKVRRVLQGRGTDTRSTTPALLVCAAQREGGDETAVREAAKGLPQRYLHSASPAQLAVHARLLTEAVGQLAADVSPGPVDSVNVLSLVARDRHRLFADAVGVLASYRIDVEQARVFTRSDGTALDWMMVSPPPDVDWPSVVADLQAAYRDDLDVAAAVAKRERARDVRPPALAEPVAVRINAVPGDGVTRVEVRGPDSPGVLYRMSRALADLGTELHGAMVSTLGPEVRNTFYVSGTVPSAEELQAALTPALLRTPAVA